MILSRFHDWLDRHFAALAIGFGAGVLLTVRLLVG